MTPKGLAPDSSADQVLIVGGGMAGSLLALVLGRAGYDVVVFDPRRDPPPMFRNEKLGHEQIAILRRLGVVHCFETACWPPPGHRDAYPDDQRPHLADCGAPHHAWLTSVRAAWPANVRFVEAVIDRVETADDVQHVETSRGETFRGRLVVLATGRMARLHQTLGVSHRPISVGHSVCLGFSVALDRIVPARVITLPYGAGVGYVSIFPMPGETRVNIFSYRSMQDPWTRRMSHDPLGGLAQVCPAAAELLSGGRILRRCEARGTDLYAADGYRRAGMVIIGDAFHAACPASGTGMLRILNDVKLLAEIHLPRWWATPGVGRDKIMRFYADPAKRAVDRMSLSRSRRGRGSAVGRGPYWSAWRTLGRVRRALRAR